MRAISVFSLEAGTSTLGWRAWIALRTRVSMSAMGSLVIEPLSAISFQLSAIRCQLPARFRHSWNLAVEGELPEAEPANTKLTQEAAWAAAAPAAVAVPGRKLRNSGLVLRLGRLGFAADLLQLDIFCNLCGCCHISPCRQAGGPVLLPERHPHLLQQRQPLRIGAGRGGDANIHSLGLFHLGVINLRENQLVLDAQGVIAAAIEALGRDAAEVAHTRQSDVHQPVEKLVHA